MAGRPTDRKLRLLHILKEEAQVDADVATWIVEADEGPQCESPADLAKFGGQLRWKPALRQTSW